jgi:hypothetical protein
MKTGNWNTIIGSGAGTNIGTGDKNIVIGSGAMGENYFAGSGTGSSNIMIGFQAGYSVSNSSSNIFIGNQAGYSETGSNKLYISNSGSVPPLIYGDFSTGTVALGTIAPSTSYKLYINGNAYSTGSWSSSDVRWKKNIVPLTDVLCKLLNLKGVSYKWRKTEFPEINFDSGEQIGLIAQDVEKVYPELVKTDAKGYKAVCYEKLSVILLEGIKEQQNQIETQQKELDELKTLVNTLVANQTGQGNK